MSITQGFTINKEDMLRSKLVKPGVYLLNIKSMEQKPSTKNPDAFTIHVTMLVKEGEFAGVPVRHFLPETAPGFAIDFLEAVTGKKLPEDGVTITPTQLLALVGRDVKAALKPIKDPVYGPQNKIEGFMPA